MSPKLRANSSLPKLKPHFHVVASRHSSEFATAERDSKVLLEQYANFVIAGMVSEEGLPSPWGWGPGGGPPPWMRRGHGVYVDRSAIAGVARLWQADFSRVNQVEGSSDERPATIKIEASCRVAGHSRRGVGWKIVAAKLSYG